MTEEPTRSRRRWPSRRRVYLGALLFLVSALTYLALILPAFTSTADYSFQEGDVAPQDVLAPYTLSFESQVLTEAQRQAAADSIEPVYAAPDTSIARQQVNQLRSALTYIDSVRSDTFATEDDKLSDLAAMEDILLSPETAQAILALSDTRWQAVQQEAISVLDQVMRSAIREDRLEDARRGVPARVSFSLQEDQAAIVVELVSAFTAPNSLYNQDLTETARQQAADAVEPINQEFLANETIVERGQIITAAHLEALEQFGLVEPQTTWQEYASAGIITAIVILLTALYLRYQPEFLNDNRSLNLVLFIYLVFLFGARLLIPNHTIIPYLFPIPTFALLITVLFNVQHGLVAAIPLGILVAYDLPNALELTLYYMLSSMVGAVILRRVTRITTFFRAGGAVALVGVGVILIYRLSDANTDGVGRATLVGAALIYGVGSALLTVLLQYLLAQILGKTTPLQLLELARPDNALLQLLLRNAPGTYQHSLQVANLAEQAAERIGADALLTRVGALYHDVGKSNNPPLFIENQAPGSGNPHSKMKPVESATYIRSHVTDGIELARQHRLPRRVAAFISEHHGNRLTRYQYVNAVKAVGGDESKVDTGQFRYVGPSPQSPETALVMMADGCEARTRAESPKTREEIQTIVKQIINGCLKDGQLDNVDLTLRDLKIIEESFANTLQGIYHPRIKYPKLDQPAESPDPAPRPEE